MSRDDSYNGWTNRETWLINVWFNPESKSDVDWAKESFEQAYDGLPDFMKDFVYDCRINWDELYSHFDDESDDESDDELSFLLGGNEESSPE